MASSLLEGLRFGEQTQSADETAGIQPISLTNFLIALHTRQNFEDSRTEDDQLQLQHTTWREFIANVALHPSLQLNLQSLENTFVLNPADEPMVELGHNQVLGLVGAVGTEHLFDDASVIVALDLWPVGYDLPERHLGESGVVRPIKLHVCGLTTGGATRSTPRILAVTYELAGLRPQSLAHQIGALCEATGFFISVSHKTPQNVADLGILKGSSQVKQERVGELPYSLSRPINTHPMVTAHMQQSVLPQQELVTGTVVHRADGFYASTASPRIQTVAGSRHNNYQVGISIGPQDFYSFPAFLGKAPTFF